MSDLLQNPPAELVRPDYNVYRYTEQIYKVVRFHSTAPLGIKSDREKHQSYDKKLDASLSRTRRIVLELALCNTWKYFGTFTISPEKFDRHDFKGWYAKFYEWMKYHRKKYGMRMDFVFVPERHEDGCWHMHGLLDDISPFLVSFADERAAGLNVPDKLVQGGYYDWPDYREKFGYCSFGLIKDTVAVSYYITKYVTKDLGTESEELGKHLYRCSKGLNRAEFHGDVYGHCAYLDQFLVNHYDFCDTGMTKLKDGCDWTFGFQYMDHSVGLDSFDYLAETDESREVDSYWEATQLLLDGF